MKIFFFPGTKEHESTEAETLALGQRELTPAGGVAEFAIGQHLFVSETDDSWVQYCGQISFVDSPKVYFNIPLRRALDGYKMWVIEDVDVLTIEGAQRHRRERDWGVESLTSVGGKPYRVKTAEAVSRRVFTWEHAKAAEIRALEAYFAGDLSDGRLMARVVYFDQGAGYLLLVNGFVDLTGWVNEEVARLGTMGFGVEVVSEEVWEG